MQRIALCLTLGNHYLHRCLRGVQEAADPQAPWLFHHFPPTTAGVAAVKRWRPDGILAAAPERKVGRALEVLGLSTVHLGNHHVAPALPSVVPDHGAVGRLAADHLLERGVRHLAFLGWPGEPFSDLRGVGFQSRCADAGLAVARLPGLRPWTADPRRNEAAVIAWLKALPTPVGLFAANDYLAWRIAELARQAGRRIPEDLALVGADDDPLVGGLIHRPLSSVQVSPRRIGLEAAAMLTRLMAGQPGPDRVAVPPLGVVARASSDLNGIADPLVRQAVTLIAQYAGGPLTITRISRELGASRRTLERHFSETLDRSILDEIQRVRVERAKTLLETTGLPMAEVARRSGFSTAARLTAVFRQATGLAPTAYREQLA